MRYLVNQSTKEHIVYNDDKMSPVGIWRIAEADDEGWIPWGGGECPLPKNGPYEINYRNGYIGGDVSDPQMHGTDWESENSPDDIIAYRPILSEAARRPGRTIAFIPPTEHNVFTRLHEATAAAESIPGIIKEIDELLAPAGYCVARRQAEPSQDEIVEKVMDGEISANTARALMAKKVKGPKNWKDGDLLECIAVPNPYFEKGHIYAIGTDSFGDFGIKDKDGHVLSEARSDGEYFSSGFFRFHSRPSKERTPCTI